MRPPSSERYTREPAGPPLPNQAWRRPEVVMHSLLAAKPYSFGACALGTFAAGSTRQLRPPFAVIRIRKRPFTGSLRIRPWRRSKKAMQS